MAYRECPNHGWLETGEYGVEPGGETICPVCESTLSGYYGDPGSRRKFGGPNHAPRQRFIDAASEFLRRVDALDEENYWDVKPIMEDYEVEN